MVDNQAQLTLEDAIAAALRRNLALVVERYRRSQTIQGIQEALGIYDFNFGASGGFGGVSLGDRRIAPNWSNGSTTRCSGS